MSGEELFSGSESCLSGGQLVECLRGDQCLLVAVQRLVSRASSFDLRLVGSDNFSGSRQGVDQSDDVFHRLVLSGKGRGVGDIACDSRERIARAVGVGAVSPAGEGVGVLCVLCLFGSSAVIFRGCAVSNFLVGFKNRSVLVLPYNGKVFNKLSFLICTEYD